MTRTIKKKAWAIVDEDEGRPLHYKIHPMTRDQLIEEIVQEALKKRCKDNDEAVEYLRSILLRISNASLDAVEVENKVPHEMVGCVDNIDRAYKCSGYNSAIAASKEKRREWCEDK